MLVHRSTFVGVLLLLSLGLASCAQQPSQTGQTDGTQTGASQNKAVRPPSSLRITFFDKSAGWVPSAFASLPHKSVTVHNEHTKADETYSGVPLIDLLTKVGVPANPHGKDLALYLVATGADGYRVVYSVAEVNPDVHDATVIVADALDGKPLTDGPFKLVANRDTRPARWVHNLATIRVIASR